MLRKIATHTVLLSSLIMAEANSATHGRAWNSTNQGKFAASFHMGIMPGFYADRTTPNGSLNFNGINPPNFSKQFNMPIDLVGELGYMAWNNVEFFYNFDWSHASGKTHAFESSGISFSEKFSKYNAYGNYLGSRYYFNFQNVPVRPFVGLKIGVLSQNSVNVNQVASIPGTSVASSFNYFKKLNSLAGGFQIGVDWQLLSYLSMTLKTEIIAAEERKGPFILPALKVGDTGAQLFIPITLGIKFVM